MDEDNEPGRCKRPKSGYSRGDFNGVSDKAGLAVVLRVPKKAIDLIEPLPTMCQAKEGCLF